MKKICKTCKYFDNDCVFTAETGEICDNKGAWEEKSLEQVKEEYEKAFGIGVDKVFGRII